GWQSERCAFTGDLTKRTSRSTPGGRRGKVCLYRKAGQERCVDFFWCYTPLLVGFLESCPTTGGDMSKPKEEPKRDVIKSSAAIHIHNSITLLQRRVWNVLLFNAYNELEKKEEHQIALKDLSTLVGYDSHDMDYLKEAAEAM